MTRSPVRPQPLAADTAPAAEARQLAFFRRRGPRERLALTFELIAFARAASRAAIRRANPHLDALEQARLLMTVQFGVERAAHLRRAPDEEGPMSIPTAILPVVQALTAGQIPYYISGSIASSAYSLPRTTYDVDVVAAFTPEHIGPFVAQLADDYSVAAGSLLDAMIVQASFNMIHQATGITIAIFIPADRPFDRIQFTRVQAHTLPGTEQPVNLASPEDVILNKLAWYVLGNQVSDQQWRDVQAIIRVQGAALDQPYLQTWATALDLGDLLAAALRGERPDG